MKQKVIKYLTVNDFHRLENQIDNSRDHLILNTLYETGCTVNELINIKIKDIDGVKKTINFPDKNTKTNKAKISFISDKLISEIKNFISDKFDTYLFFTRQSPQITTKRVRQLIQYHSQKAGLGKINPQIIRYTHIAHAIEKGIPLRAIQKQVGIKQLRIVQIQESLVPEEERVYEKFWSNEN